MSLTLNESAAAVLRGDVRTIARALALRWTYTTQTQLLELLRLMGAKDASGRAFAPPAVKDAVALLNTGNLLEEQPLRQGHWRLIDPVRCALYLELLDSVPGPALREIIGKHLSPYSSSPLTSFWSPVQEQSATIALVRLIAFTGTIDEYYRVQESVSRQRDWGAVFNEAVIDTLDAVQFQRLAPALREDIGIYFVRSVLAGDAKRLPLCRWLADEPVDGWLQQTPVLRAYLAEWMLHGADHEHMEALLKGMAGAVVDGLRAGAQAQSGDWAAAQLAFEAAMKARGEEIGAKKRLFPVTLAWYYPLILLARQDMKSLQTARKFCLGEAGSRNPEPFGWGLWAHVIGARLGETPLNVDLLRYHGREPGWALIDGLWKLLLRAWAQNELPPMNDIGHVADVAGQLASRLRGLGMNWMARQADLALAVIRGEEAPGFFVGAGQEKWRSVLAALTALGDDGNDSGQAARGSEARLLWAVSLGKDGRVVDIAPMEQKRGVRSWSKPKALPLSRLVGNAKLAPWDAKVAQALRTERHNKRLVHLDLAAAMGALIGHPVVVLGQDYDTLVDVIAGTPELEVVREQVGDSGRFRLRLSPEPLGPDPRAPAYFPDEARAAEYLALRSTVVLRDSPQRLRVIRFTPAQKRAAQLVAAGIQVPDTAQGELQNALRALAGHFAVHSDDAASSRQIEAETRLRAELSPAGEGLLLRLVVAPLGEHGPRLMPGHGRTRITAAINGESVGAERNLVTEQANLEAVLSALSFLDPPASGDTVCEWNVDEPELALGMLETLTHLTMVAALDWPRGKAVKVTTLDVKHVQMSVRAERDWFRVEGRAALDEGRVFELQQLLAAAAQRSRFVALGEGAYLALSKSLRDKLQALAAVAERDKQGLRAPQLAAPWLDDTLSGLDVEFDKSVRQRIDRLRLAHELTPVIPAGLQAELRAYQDDGYAWAMRLAEAGFGACLADDMGLGKTLQALAVMLARAAGGPALVVAPTSVCGNWQAEAARFAPGLRVVIYGETERESLIEGAAAGDVVIVSYTLMQQAGEAFAARSWHTVVADEAQAVKNALTKRSQALFDIPADFRMALSGTPVENRLAELWSIMRFCNPGLLGTLAHFNERFSMPIERNRDRDAQRLLRRLIAPFVLRRTKSEVLDDLPPRTELVLSVVPDKDEAAHYEALRRHLVSEAETLTDAPAGQAHMHILAQLTKLRRAACDPRLVTPDLNYTGAKVRAFTDLVTELADNGHTALVFSQFVDFLTLLREPLDAAGIPYHYLDGSTPAAERTRRVAAFQAGESKLFLISLKAGGFGLNLTAADYVVITDPWWNPAAEDQAMGRAHRIGQLRPVTVYRLVSKGTLEERIIELHHDKRALAEGVLAEGGEGATLPSTDELIDLLRG